MVSQSGKTTAPPALVAKLAEAFCSYMDTDEHYSGTPCDACVALAEQMAPQVEEELMKPSEDDIEPVEGSVMGGIEVLQRYAQYDEMELNRVVGVAKNILVTTDSVIEYSHLVEDVRATAKVTETLAAKAVNILLDEGLLEFDDEVGFILRIVQK